MTLQDQVVALVRHRMRLGVSKTRARLELADALGATELSIRKWEKGSKPLPVFVRAITRLYEEETNG